MNIVKILGKSGRMELADLASLLLPVPVAKKKGDEPDGDGFGEDCEGCEEDDEDECVVCMLRSIIHKVDQNGKSSDDDSIFRGTKLRAEVKFFPSVFWRSL